MIPPPWLAERPHRVPFLLVTGTRKASRMVRGFVTGRRLSSIAAVALLATGLALVSESGATAAPTNASSFDVALLVRLEIGSPRPAGELRPSVTLVPPPGAFVPGHVDRAGNWSTDAGVTLGSITDPIDRASDTLLAEPLDEVRLSAPVGLSGTVDPGAHTIDLHAPDASFTFVGNHDPGNHGDPFSCTSVPAPLDLTSVDYDAAIGIATFSASDTFQFAFPDIPECDGVAEHFASRYASVGTIASFLPALTADGPIGGAGGAGSPATPAAPAAPVSPETGSVPPSFPDLSGLAAPGATEPTSPTTGPTSPTSRSTGATTTPRPARASTGSASSAIGGAVADALTKLSTPETGYVWRGAREKIELGPEPTSSQIAVPTPADRGQDLRGLRDPLRPRHHRGHRRRTGRGRFLVALRGPADAPPPRARRLLRRRPVRA